LRAPRALMTRLLTWKVARPASRTRGIRNPAQHAPRPSKAAKALQLMMQRYPPQNAPLPAPDTTELRIFRVTPSVISVLDYSKGFGHTDLITCQSLTAC